MYIFLAVIFAVTIVISTVVEYMSHFNKYINLLSLFKQSCILLSLILVLVLFFMRKKIVRIGTNSFYGHINYHIW